MPASTRTHILISDGEERLLNSMQFFFHWKGYRVSKANSGPDALAIIRKCSHEGNRIDILIVGIELPGMTSEVLVRVVREFDAHLPILVMAGFGRKEMAIRMMQFGASGYIEQPFSLDHIENRVELMLAQARASFAGRTPSSDNEC
jgi:DNA-binding response OmpR family regulator